MPGYREGGPVTRLSFTQKIVHHQNIHFVLALPLTKTAHTHTSSPNMAPFFCSLRIALLIFLWNQVSGCFQNPPKGWINYSCIIYFTHILSHLLDIKIHTCTVWVISDVFSVLFNLQRKHDFCGWFTLKTAFFNTRPGIMWNLSVTRLKSNLSKPKQTCRSLAV